MYVDLYGNLYMDQVGVLSSHNLYRDTDLAPIFIETRQEEDGNHVMGLNNSIPQ